MDKYDLLIVGAGPGGYVGALKAAQLGMKVAIAESRQIGGTCLNRGCIPTKTLLHSAAILREIKNCATLGIEVAGVDFDFAAMHRRKNQVVEQLRGGVEALLKANKIDLLAGKAKVTAIGQTEVAGRTIVADKILLAAGSVPLLLPLPGADSARVLTSDDILSGEQPFFPRLLIIGGGVIGMEFAAFFNDLGGEVTVLESLDRVLANFDKSISQNLSMIMKKRGVKVYTAAQAIRMESDEQGICCYFRHKEQELSVTGDALLMAVGRRAASADLVAADMDLQLERGRIRTDQRYQTSLSGIYAIGDIRAGGVQLAHGASAEAINAVSMMAGLEAPLNMNYIPSCVYTDPEIACVGLTMEQAQAQAMAAVAGKFLMSANGKNLIETEDRSFIQVVAEAGSERLLGAQLMCRRATDMIGGLTTAMVNGLNCQQALAAIYPHPSFSEGIGEAFEDIHGQSLHTLPKKR